MRNSGHPEHFRKIWSAWILSKRDGLRLTNRDIAKATEVDASYITLMQRDGYIPARDVVERIGRGIGDLAGALLAAGYMPTPDEVTESRQRLSERLSPSSKRLFTTLSEMPHEQQDAVIRSILEALYPLGPFTRVLRKPRAAAGGGAA